MLKED